MATREPGVVTAALNVMSRSKADAECQRAKGHATSAQIEERKRLDLRYLRYPAKTGFALSALSSKRLDLRYLRYLAKEDWISAIGAIQQKTGLALSALSSKRLN